MMSATVVIRSLVRATHPGLDEAVLLSSAASGDAVAFAELVRRHGPMVLGVCRRVLGPTADADDAFQQTFLALVEHAGSIRTPAALPGWLHRTAFRAAGKLKARRPAPAPADTPEPTISSDPLADLSWKEVRAMLDEELNSLPEALRAPLVLCYLDGRTRDDAAAALGVSLSTLKRRVEDGLNRLNRRLTRRGVGGLGLAVAALGGTCESGLTAPVSAALARHVEVTFCSRSVGAVGVSSLMMGWKSAVSMVLLVGGLATAGMVLSGPGDPVNTPPEKVERVEKPDTPKLRVDVFGDPLPEGAVLRLGSVLFRQDRLHDFVLLPDGKSVLTTGLDHQLRTWDLTTGRETRKVPEDAPVQWPCSLSPDGRYATGFDGKNLIVFDTKTGKEKTTVSALGYRFHKAFFSPDGRTIAMLTWEPRLTLVDWESKTEQELPLPQLQLQPATVFHGYFSRTGKWVVVDGGTGKSVCVFDAATGKEKHRLNYDASASAITPDDKTLVVSVPDPTGHAGCELVKFDLTTGQESARFKLEKERYYYSLDVSPDGKTIACGSSDSSCLVDLSSGRLLHRLTGRPLALTFTRDGKHLIGNTGQKLRVWTTADGKELLDRPGTLDSMPVLAVSPDGRWLVSAGWMVKGLTVWDMTDGRVARTIPLEGKHRRNVREIGFSPDGGTLWVGDSTGLFQWWDFATATELKTRQFRTASPALQTFMLRVRVSQDGQTVAALEEVVNKAEWTQLTLWDISSGAVKAKRSLPPRHQFWAWTRDDSTIAFATSSGLVVADGADPSRTRFTIEGVLNSPIAFSRDGRLLAARKTGDEVIVVEVASGSVAAVVKTGPAFHLGLAAGGRMLVATGENALKVFDVASGNERGRRPLPALVSGLFIPDETRALTALADGTGLMWDLSAFAVQSASSGETPAKLWDVLAETSATAAHKAGWELVDRPAEAVAMLREKLKPARPLEEAMVQSLVAKLDHQDFATREAATKALQELGAIAAPALRSALKGEASPERANRIKRLLALVNAPVVPPGERLRELRAVAILERIGTAEARKQLDELAGGVSDARLTLEAAAAVARLKGRSK